jgi:hypothetical protein
LEKGDILRCSAVVDSEFRILDHSTPTKKPKRAESGVQRTLPFRGRFPISRPTISDEHPPQMISPSRFQVKGTQIYKTITRRSERKFDQHRSVLHHHHHHQITTCSTGGALPLSHFHSWINRRISSEAKKPTHRSYSSSQPGAIQAIDVGSARAPDTQYPLTQTFSKHTQNNSRLNQLSQPYAYHHQQKHTQLSPSCSYSSSLACENPRLSPFSPSSLTLHSKFNNIIHNTLHPLETPSIRVKDFATHLSTHPRSKNTLLRPHSASPTRVKWIVPDFDRLIRQRLYSKFDLPINTSSPPPSPIQSRDIFVLKQFCLTDCFFPVLDNIFSTLSFLSLCC